MIYQIFLHLCFEAILLYGPLRSVFNIFKYLWSHVFWLCFKLRIFLLDHLSPQFFFFFFKSHKWFDRLFDVLLIIVLL